MIAFSFLYTVNIAISNVSLNMVSLPFHQIVRSTNPAFTILMEMMIIGKRHSKETYLSLLPVILGVALATLGEYEFSLAGFFCTIFGVILSALKGIVTNMLLVGPLKLHPLDLLWRMSLLSFFQCLFISKWTGELEKYSLFIQDLGEEELLPGEHSFQYFGLFGRVSPNQSALYFALLCNGILAFAINYVSFSANKKTSALSMTVAGNVKQALSIILSVWIFKYIISMTNGLGNVKLIIMSLFFQL